MKLLRLPRIPLAAFTLLLLFTLFITSCASLLPQPEPTPVVQTRVVTQQVIRQVTLEVTQVVEVPVTVTPTETLQVTYTPSLTPTITGTSTITSTPEPPRAAILEHVDCFYGPADFYLYKTSWLAGDQVELIGRSQDATWINVQEIHGWNACWIPADQAKLDTGSIADLPFVYTALPLTRYEYRSPTTTAQRNGNEVMVTWEPIWMSIDELRGYLIEAWVCQAGQLVFLPVGINPTYEENASSFTVKITDEAGCMEPSSARIATATKRGYTPFEKIFWPPH
jgi:hypothetical protein